MQAPCARQAPSHKASLHFQFCGLWLLIKDGLELTGSTCHHLDNVTAVTKNFVSGEVKVLRQGIKPAAQLT